MNTNCHDIVGQLPALQDGELVPAEEQALRAHLQTCQNCSQIFAGLVAIDRGLSADAAWKPVSNGLAAGVIRIAEARPRDRLSRASRALRFALPLAAAAMILVLATAVVVRWTSRPPTPAPIYVVAPRMVVDEHSLAEPSAAPSVATRPPVDAKLFQLGAAPGPVGRAFVVCDGQLRSYDGPVSVTIDRMPSGPAALRVDAFPRERHAAPKASAKRL